MSEVRVGGLTIGNSLPFTLIAGPCQIESLGHTMEVASALAELSKNLGIGVIYKSIEETLANLGLPPNRKPGNMGFMVHETDGRFHPAAQGTDEIGQRIVGRCHLQRLHRKHLVAPTPLASFHPRSPLRGSGVGVSRTLGNSSSFRATRKL